MVHRARHTMNKSRGGFFSHLAHRGTEFLGGVDHFVRRHGPTMKNAAMMIAPALLKAGNPALAAGVATAGQAADSYSTLRNQLD